MTPIDWLLSRDTGISSKTILSVMTGTHFSNPARRYDADDFGRCYHFLRCFPGWRDRLPEVAAKYPAWKPLVRQWDKLTEMYEREVRDPRIRELSDYIRSLHDECMEADGWVKTGPHSWSKPEKDACIVHHESNGMSVEISTGN